MLIHKTIRLEKFLLNEIENEVKNIPDVKDKSQLIRNILFNHFHKKEQNRAIEFLEELKMFRQEFSRIGSNLNQIAHSYNMSEQINRSDLENNHEELRQEFKKISKQLKILNGNFQQ